MRPISRAGNSSPLSVAAQAGRRDGEDGFVLIDALAALVLTALALGIAFAAIPHGTSGPRLAAIAHEIATYLTETRTHALLSGRDSLTLIDSSRRTIVSGRQMLTLPNDVGLSVLSADTCARSGAAVGVVFRPDGSSCGAVIRIRRGGDGYRIRVNWYTGHVEILGL